MSHENVEVVRRWLEALNRGDVAGVLGLADPDVEWWNRADDPGAPVTRGHDGLTQGLAELDESIAELRVEPEEFIDVGECVVVSVCVVGRGRESGASFEEHEVHMFRLRDGKVTEGREYRDRSEAFEALGLAEYAMSQETMEFAERGLVAINETYRTGDMRAWRAHVEETFDPDIVLETSGEAFTEGEWRGHEGAVGFVANQMEVLDDMWLRVDEYLRVDAELLVVAISFGGRAQHTGIEVELHPLHVFRLQDGKAVRWQVFLDRAKALEATGLGE